MSPAQVLGQTGGLKPVSGSKGYTFSSTLRIQGQGLFPSWEGPTLALACPLPSPCSTFLLAQIMGLQ